MAGIPFSPQKNKRTEQKPKTHVRVKIQFARLVMRQQSTN